MLIQLNGTNLYVKENIRNRRNNTR